MPVRPVDEPKPVIEAPTRSLAPRATDFGQRRQPAG